VQRAIKELVSLGRFPSAGNADTASVSKAEKLIERIETPTTVDEAQAMVSLLGPDDFFGLAWSLIFKLEITKGWAIENIPGNTSETWLPVLKRRLEKQHELTPDA